MKKLMLHIKHASKGQSLVELTFVLLFLLMLLVGMVELGNLLNVYIGLVDGAREGARFASTSDPFSPVPAGSTCPTPPSFETCIDQVIEGLSTPKNAGALAPIILNPATDDVIISYFTVIQNPSPTPATIIRWPNNGRGYWCKYCDSQPVGVAHASQITIAQVQAAIDSNAPSTGVVAIEIYYSYHQLLNLPFFSSFANPMPVNTYTIMPLSAAEPTATLCPTPVPSGTC